LTTDLRTVEAIFSEHFDEAGKPLAKMPNTVYSDITTPLVNFIDNIGVFYRDYRSVFPELLPFLVETCVSGL
jgi:hypothetical protein